MRKKLYTCSFSDLAHVHATVGERETLYSMRDIRAARDVKEDLVAQADMKLPI